MSVYREEIMDHFKKPRNFGPTPPRLRGASRDKWKVVEERNSSCGDVIRLGVRLTRTRLTRTVLVREIRFEGEGCAISLASTSMLTEMIKGKSLKEVRSLSEAQILTKLGIPISSARKKCATLGLSAWQKLQKKLI
jgi:nitrogen fixation protein NifU and related proteins